MSFQRIVLVLGAAGFAGFGLIFAVAPEMLARQIDLGIASPAARTDVRAVYGGLEIGIAVFLFWCASAPHRVRFGLIALTTCFGAVFAARLLGIILDGSLDPLTLSLLAVEVGGTVLGTIALAAPEAETVFG